jgi:hypothetical protein
LGGWQPIDIVKWNKQFPASDAEAERVVQKQLKEEKHNN